MSGKKFLHTKKEDQNDPLFSTGWVMRVTINIPQRAIYIGGTCHQLSRAGVNRLFLWLMDNGALLWGWDCGEYVFDVGVNYATDNR